MLLVVPGVSLVLLRTITQDQLDELLVSPEPAFIEAEAMSDLDVQGVVVELTWGAAPQVPAPPWTGIVTDVVVEPGDTVSADALLLRVDDIARLAHQATTPWFRHLARGDTGLDVSMLESYLAERDWFDELPDEFFTSGTSLAVRALERSLGVSEPTGQFDPGWFVWIGPETFQVSSVDVRVGFPAPNLGESVLTGSPTLQSMTFQTSADGRPLELDGERILNLQDEEYRLVDGELGNSEKRLMSLQLSPGVEQVAGQVERAEPQVVFVVPATAVIAGSSDLLCVYTRRTDELEPTVVRLAGGEGSTVNVSSGLAAGDLVLINPGDVLASPTCR